MHNHSCIYSLKFHAHVLHRRLQPSTKLYIFYSLIEEAEQVRRWLAPLDSSSTPINQEYHRNNIEFVPQAQSNNLGDRLQHAFSHIVSKNTHQRIAVVGTDIPDITSSILQQAFDALDAIPPPSARLVSVPDGTSDHHHHAIASPAVAITETTSTCTQPPYDIIFGPALDGGYYLLGLNCSTDRMYEASTLQRLFADVAWSTDSVLQHNIQNALNIGLRVAPLEHSLPILCDIDTVHDLHAWMGSSDGGGSMHYKKLLDSVSSALHQGQIP